MNNDDDNSRTEKGLMRDVCSLGFDTANYLPRWLWHNAYALFVFGMSLCWSSCHDNLLELIRTVYFKNIHCSPFHNMLLVLMPDDNRNIGLEFLCPTPLSVMLPSMTSKHVGGGGGIGWNKNRGLVI